MRLLKLRYSNRTVHIVLLSALNDPIIQKPIFVIWFVFQRTRATRASFFFFNKVLFRFRDFQTILFTLGLWE